MTPDKTALLLVITLLARVCVAFHTTPGAAKLRHNRSTIQELDSAAISSSSIGWDSHTAIDSIPDSLVRSIDGNASMRRKFEQVCRNAQVSYCVSAHCANSHPSLHARRISAQQSKLLMAKVNFDLMPGSERTAVVVFLAFSREETFSRKPASISPSSTALCLPKLYKQRQNVVLIVPKVCNQENVCHSSPAVCLQ